MSQPDRIPEEAPEPEGAPGEESPPARSRFLPRRAPRRRRPGPEDLRALPFPLGDWAEPADRLAELYHWAEENALRTADWYLTDRLSKRQAARALRLGAALSGTAAAALPLLELAHGRGPLARWGYLALLLCGVCFAADRLFGLTSGWMRDVATAQAVQRRVDALRFDWAAESVREVLGPTEGTAAEAADRCLAVLRTFCEDVADLVRGETSDWIATLGGPCAATALHAQSPAFAPAPRPARFSPPRLPHPAARPTMPRQRPPEGPR